MELLPANVEAEFSSPYLNLYAEQVARNSRLRDLGGDDLLSEARLRLSQSARAIELFDRYQGNPAQLKSYLKQTILNIARDLLRLRKNRFWTRQVMVNTEDTGWLQSTNESGPELLHAKWLVTEIRSRLSPAGCLILDELLGQDNRIAYAHRHNIGERQVRRHLRTGWSELRQVVQEELKKDFGTNASKEFLAAMRVLLRTGVA